MPVVLRFFSVLPLWLLHALGAALGWVAFCASARYRQRFCAHAALAGYSFGAVRAAPWRPHGGRAAGLVAGRAAALPPGGRRLRRAGLRGRARHRLPDAAPGLLLTVGPRSAAPLEPQPSP